MTREARRDRIAELWHRLQPSVEAGNNTPTPEAVELAIGMTEYKYFGDYEMSESQRWAVNVLVALAERSKEQT